MLAWPQRAQDLCLLHPSVSTHRAPAVWQEGAACRRRERSSREVMGQKRAGASGRSRERGQQSGHE